MISILPRMDAALLVAGVGSTSVSDIKECQKHLQRTPVVRVVVNKATGNRRLLLRLLLTSLNGSPAGRKAAISEAGTKYLAISRVSALPLSGPVRDLRNFSAHDPEQASLLCIEHPRSGISGPGNVRDDRAETCGSQSEVVRARRCGKRTCSWGQRSQLVDPGKGGSLHSVHRRSLRRDRKKIFVDRQKRQIGSFKAAFLDDTSRIFLTGNDDLGPRHPGSADHVRRSNEQAVSMIDAVSRPALLRRPMDVDRIGKQRVVENPQPGLRAPWQRSMISVAYSWAKAALGEPFVTALSHANSADPGRPRNAD